MKLRLAALPATAALMIALAACGQVQEAAEKAVNDGASQVATAAAGEVKKQVCALVGDGVSVQDKELLRGLVAGAETAGVSADITAPLRQIAEAGDQVPAASVKALQDACVA